MSPVRARFVLACGLLVWCVTSASAQVRQNVGPGKCVECHDHAAEKEWWQTKDGDPAKGKQHAKADRRLEDPKAAAYSKAIGLADVYNPSGSCVSCHSTVVSGSADFGVTCESCHGPGRDYLTPHQTKGTYAAAVKLGMADVKEKPDAWAPTCMGCHVLASRPNMQALIAAGHSSGSDFDLARKFPAVAQHFKAKYQPSQIATAAAAFKPASVPVAATVPAPRPAAPVAPPAPAPTPAPTPTPAVPVVAVVNPVQPPAPRPPTVVTQTSLPPIAPAPVPAARPAPPVAEAAANAAVPAPVAEPPRPIALTPEARVASMQGRLTAWLTQLLNTNIQANIPAPPPARQVYRGHDAELLRLQDQVIRLALETLAAPPKRQ